MSQAKLIKWKIASVSNIKKMTRALEIVSTVKLQKIKKQTEQYRNFIEEFLKVAHVVHAKLDLFSVDVSACREKTLLIVSWSEKWLCWSLNSKLFKDIFQKYDAVKEDVEIFCIGKKSLEFFARTGFTIAGSLNLKDDFVSDDLESLYSFISAAITEKQYNDVVFYFNYFKNPIKQIPIDLTLFPLNKQNLENFTEQVWQISLDQYRTDDVQTKDLVVEPTTDVLRTEMIQQLIQHMIYWWMLQNKAGEFSARMLAMKNAKDSASWLIKDLTLIYNKARQAAITQEVSEIVSAKIALEE